MEKFPMHCDDERWKTKLKFHSLKPICKLHMHNAHTRLKVIPMQFTWLLSIYKMEWNWMNPTNSNNDKIDQIKWDGDILSLGERFENWWFGYTNRADNIYIHIFL